MTIHAIPAKAVEAAAIAMEDAALKLIGSDLGTTHRNAIARLALEAAAPHMLAGAKAEALEEAAGAMTREQPGHGPWGVPQHEHQAHWLRDRANELRTTP